MEKSSLPIIINVSYWAKIHRFLKFLMVGAIGFVCDAGLLLLLINQYDWSPYYARLPSFIFAVSITWLLNRFITFSDTKRSTKTDEYASYVAVQIGGMLINFAVYTLLLTYASYPFDLPLLALACGAIPALVFNYAGAKYVVYNSKNYSMGCLF